MSRMLISLAIVVAVLLFLNDISRKKMQMKVVDPVYLGEVLKA